MARIERTMTVEKVLNNQEARKDATVLKEISEDLPSASKVKISKKNEDSKDYITSIPAEDFNSEKDKQEFIKNKFAKKYGGGEYIIELVDSEGTIVAKSMVSILSDSPKSEDNTKQAKIVEQALEMRESAFEKVKEVEEEKREVERQKYDTLINGMEKQWEMISRMYENQISNLKTQIDNASDKQSRDILQLEISRINREYEDRRNRYEIELRTQGESKQSSDKMFDLMNTLIPSLISKSNDNGKDPVEEFSKMFTLVEKLTGGKKDLIESMIENPSKIDFFQRMMGISSENGKKDFFEEMMGNPVKLELFRKMIGAEEKKGFFEEMMENTQKFELMKKMMGFDKTEAMVRELTDMAHGPQVPIEQPRGFLEELIDTTSKLEAAKPVLRNILGVQSAPVKSFIELIGTIINSPYIVQAAATVMNGLANVEMIKKGMAVQPGSGFAGAPQQPQQQPQQQQQQQQGPENNKNGDRKEVNIEKAFEEIIIKVANTNKDGVISSSDFAEMVSNKIVDYVNEYPDAMLKILKYGGFENITKLMTNIITRLLGTNEEASKVIAEEIANKVITKITGK